jgi:hypothetical protein
MVRPERFAPHIACIAETDETQAQLSFADCVMARCPFSIMSHHNEILPITHADTARRLDFCEQCRLQAFKQPVRQLVRLLAKKIGGCNKRGRARTRIVLNLQS